MQKRTHTNAEHVLMPTTGGIAPFRNLRRSMNPPEFYSVRTICPLRLVTRLQRLIAHFPVQALPVQALSAVSLYVAAETNYPQPFRHARRRSRQMTPVLQERGQQLPASAHHSVPKKLPEIREETVHLRCTLLWQVPQQKGAAAASCLPGDLRADKTLSL